MGGMPYSRSRNLFYCHIPKTAGTSLTRALVDAGIDLELNGFGIWDTLMEHDRRAEIIAIVRQGFAHATLAAYPQGHLPASAARIILGEEMWRSAFKFAFVRNPWDLVVSTYFYLREHTQDESVQRRTPDQAELLRRCDTFSKYARMYPAVRSDMLTSIADEQGNIIIDFVGRLESLGRDFDHVCRHSGLTLSLPHVNESQHGHYRDYYTPETEKIIARHFQRDIETFHYTF